MSNKLVQICFAGLSLAVLSNALRFQFSERVSMIHKNEDIASCASFAKTNGMSEQMKVQTAVFREAIDALTEVKADYWLTDGTLLGLYRSCSMLAEGSPDIDIAVNLKWWEQNGKEHFPGGKRSAMKLWETTNTLEGAMLRRNFTASQSSGKISKFGFEITWKKNNVKVDFFSASKMSDVSQLQDPETSGVIEEYKRMGKFSNNKEINLFFGRSHLGKMTSEFPASWQAALWIRVIKPISVGINTNRGVRQIVNFNWKQINDGRTFIVRIPDPSDGLHKIEASTKEFVAKALDSEAASASEASKYSSLVNVLVSSYGLEFQEPPKSKYTWHSTRLKSGSCVLVTPVASSA